MPKIREFLLIITGLSESGKVILQVSIVVFWAWSKNFRAKMAQPPRKKLAHNMPMIKMHLGRGSAVSLSHKMVQKKAK